MSYATGVFRGTICPPFSSSTNNLPLLIQRYAETSGLWTFVTGPLIRHLPPFSSDPSYTPVPCPGTNSPDAVLKVTVLPGFTLMAFHFSGIAVWAAPVSRLNFIHSNPFAWVSFTSVPFTSNSPISSSSGAGSSSAPSYSSASSKAAAPFFPVPFEPFLPEPFPLPFLPLEFPLPGLSLFLAQQSEALCPFFPQL